MDAIPFAPRRRFFFAAPAPARQLVRPNPRPRPRPPASPARPLPKKIRGALSGLSLGVFFCIFSRGVPPDCGLAENRPPVVLISGASWLARRRRPEYHLGAVLPVYGHCGASFLGVFSVRQKKSRQKSKTAANPTLTIRAPHETNIRDPSASVLSSPAAESARVGSWGARRFAEAIGRAFIFFCDIIFLQV